MNGISSMRRKWPEAIKTEKERERGGGSPWKFGMPGAGAGEWVVALVDALVAADGIEDLFRCVVSLGGQAGLVERADHPIAVIEPGPSDPIGLLHQCPRVSGRFVETAAASERLIAPVERRERQGSVEAFGIEQFSRGRVFAPRVAG